MITEKRRLETTELLELRVVLEKIISTVRPERVFCLGVRVNNYEEWSVFKSAAPGTPHATVDLLIVIPSSDKRRIHEIDEALTLYNSATLQLNTMVHPGVVCEKGC